MVTWGQSCNVLRKKDALVDWRGCFSCAWVIVILPQNYRNCQPSCYSLYKTNVYQRYVFSSIFQGNILRHFLDIFKNCSTYSERDRFIEAEFQDLVNVLMRNSGLCYLLVYYKNSTEIWIIDWYPNKLLTYL